MAIGLGIGLFLIVLGIACEFVVAHLDAPTAPRPAVPAGR
ncbi:hypothetical protein ABIE44_001793 [Marmoricola sp. OAE513]